MIINDEEHVAEALTLGHGVEARLERPGAAAFQRRRLGLATEL